MGTHGKVPGDQLSDRLAEQLRSESFPAEFIERLNRADFSTGRSGQSDVWARHNERIHVAVVIVSEQRGFSAAMDLVKLDWRDLLVAAGLAAEDWPRRVSDWFAGRQSD